MADLFSNLQSSMTAPPVAPELQPIADYYKNIAEGERSQARTSGMLGEAQYDVGEAERLRKAQGLGDYRRENNEIGGWNFFDPEGNPITAFQYARGSGKSLSSALADSLDPGDYKFIQDYNDFQDMATDPSGWIANREKNIDKQIKEEIDAYEEEAERNDEEIDEAYEDEIRQQGETMKVGIRRANPSNALKELIQEYQHIFLGR